MISRNVSFIPPFCLEKLHYRPFLRRQRKRRRCRVTWAVGERVDGPIWGVFLLAESNYSNELTFFLRRNWYVFEYRRRRRRRGRRWNFCENMFEIRSQSTFMSCSMSAKSPGLFRFGFENCSEMEFRQKEVKLSRVSCDNFCTKHARVYLA